LTLAIYVLIYTISKPGSVALAQFEKEKEMKSEKGQGIVEYSLVILFVAGVLVALAIFAPWFLLFLLAVAFVLAIIVGVYVHHLRSVAKAEAVEEQKKHEEAKMKRAEAKAKKAAKLADPED
jgi:flagellar biosynthesis component FlhA